jgi:tetratricopeptide (TPR) repeat protein
MYLKDVIKNFLVLLFLTVIILGCSRKNNSFSSRNLHALGTKYNVMYNGNLALQQGLNSLEDSYQDNYWEVLPVERMVFLEEAGVESKKEKDPNFERAEDKAVKAVQKHSMLINQEEYNPQIDEAYLLLGKARYYDQRFIPALEAFNYILQFMPESNQINAASVWRERTNMRLDNNETAVTNLKKLLSQEDVVFEKEDLAYANATLSQAYLNMKMIDSALIYMYKAANQTENRDTEGRYKFIAGQLYTRMGQTDSALVYFDRVIELHRKIPRNYYLNAFIEKIKIQQQDATNRAALFLTLDELELNRENRPWLDDIYSRKAILFEEMDSMNTAESFYKKALKTPGSIDQYLRGNNYLALGKIYFDNAKYVDAGKYYDSAVSSYKERTPEYRGVRKKRDNLEDVITYELRRRSADSIFSVLDLSATQRVTYYQNYIDDLIAQEKRLEEQAEIDAANAAQGNASFQNFNNQKAGNSNNLNSRGKNAPPQIGPSFSNKATNSSNFYFYNQQTVARGIQDFKSKWGTRELVDNWRRKNRKAPIKEIEDDLVEEVIEEELKPQYTTDFYTTQLPQDAIILDSIADARDFAYYQLGVIYKEKFKRNDLAISRFDKLLTYNPEEKLELPALYNLYLIYKEGVDAAFAKAEQLKNKIITEYPDSRYAKILNNPEQQLDDDSSPEAVYKKMYRLYQKEDYAAVIAQAEKYGTIFNGDAIIPKMELLKSFSAGRLYGVDEYRKGLDYVALSFPNSDEGKAAQKLSQDSKSLSITTAFENESTLNNFKLIYQIPLSEVGGIKPLKDAIEKVILDKGYSFPVSLDVYDQKYKLLTVHGFKSKLAAQGLIDLLLESDEKIDVPFIPIASKNYEVIQAYKNLDTYLQNN